MIKNDKYKLVDVYQHRISKKIYSSHFLFSLKITKKSVMMSIVRHFL